jgi:hypothetical protein
VPLSISTASSLASGSLCPATTALGAEPLDLVDTRNPLLPLLRAAQPERGVDLVVDDVPRHYRRDLWHRSGTADAVKIWRDLVMSFSTPAANLGEAAMVSSGWRRNRGSASRKTALPRRLAQAHGARLDLTAGLMAQPPDCKANDRTKERQMPMIDVYAQPGTFPDRHRLAQGLAQAVMRWGQVPDIPLFSSNTAAFVHDLPEGSISDAAGEGNHVRVQVLTPAGVLDREKQAWSGEGADRDRRPRVR